MMRYLLNVVFVYQVAGLGEPSVFARHTRLKLGMLSASRARGNVSLCAKSCTRTFRLAVHFPAKNV